MVGDEDLRCPATGAHLRRDGTVLRTVFHIGIIETDTNSETGRSLPLRGSVYEVWDYGANTREMSGAVWIGNEPGAGTWVQEVGRIEMTLDEHIVTFMAGPHPAFFEGGIDPAVCAALA